MKRTVSLKKNSDFKRVYNKGISVADKYLVLYCCMNGLEINRLGISVSKKVGKCVTRNLIKRRLKASMTIFEENIKSGNDFVIIARKPASDAEYSVLYNSFVSLVKKQNCFLAAKFHADTKSGY